MSNAGAYKHLRTARKMALRSQAPNRMGACLVNAGRVMASGFNRTNDTNHLVRKYFQWPTVHAEIDVLARLSPSDIKNGILYIFRLKKKGDPGLSKPCERCMQAIRELGVKRIVYTTDDDPFFNIIDVR